MRSRASRVSSVSSAGAFGSGGALLLLQLAPRAGQRQAIDEQQVLDPQHALDVAAPIDPRTAFGLRDAQVGKLGLPRPKHVRLDLRDFADLRLPEQGPIGNLNRVHGGHEAGQV